MSLATLDKSRRMKDYLTAADLSTDGCAELAAEVLKAAAEDLANAARHAARYPSPDNIHHLEERKKFYRSDLYAALCCGLVDGETAMNEIIEQATRKMDKQREEVFK